MIILMEKIWKFYVEKQIVVWVVGYVHYFILFFWVNNMC
jgi:hypothetical protein